ncbi:MAG: hypothetical protein JWP44_5080 [Mucilaginibacter sp.]|nr:hypothetical protein [Mucilaginibacter sp.]
MTTGGMSTPSTMTPERLIEFLKENIEIRTKLTLDGTDLTFRTQMIVRHNNQETIVSDDEDSVDLDGLLDHL